MAWVVTALLSVALVGYNNLLNRWHPFHGPAYVPLNLLFAIVTTGTVAAVLDLSRAEIGLTADPGDLLVGLIGVAVFGTAALFLSSSRYAHHIADRRVVGLRGRALAYQTLVRIPLGTAFTEELLFRGALFAAWRASGVSEAIAAACAALVFGLWHIAPTVLLVRINVPHPTRRQIAVSVVGATAFTTMAGLVLTWLRLRTGGLLAPMVLHAGINSIGVLAAVTAGRRSTRPA